MKVLIIGGGGYIGSHLVREFTRSRPTDEVVVLDSLEATKGFHDHLPKSIPLEIGDARDVAFLDAVFINHKPDAIIFMSGSIVVSDSMRDPLAYYDNNVISCIRISQAMVRHGVNKLVFSSTAALFGTPERQPIEPEAKKDPESVYGDTKNISESIFRACDSAYGIKTVCLRYFNACGADEDGDIGETHDPETHLIPLVLQVALGQREHIKMYGTDYNTPDGTCVRDYVHVTDLSTAHINALDYLAAGNPSNQFNLGSGSGYSVREVVDSCRRVTGHTIPAEETTRRAGDPPMLVASSEKAKQVLGWAPRYTTLDAIVSSAWKFHSTHPKGYSGGRQCC